MIKHKFKLFIVALLFLVISIPGVYATWQYAEISTFEVDTSVNVSLEEFGYAPEEVLPGDKEATDLHVNHWSSIDSIVNHVDYGLNANKKPIVRELLEDGAGVVHYNQSVSGGNLKHMLLDESDVEALGFAVQYSTDTEYIAYTFVSDLAYSSNVGAEIEVYKTIIVKENGKWKATLSYKGVAKVAYISTVSVYSIDVETYR